MEKTKNINNAEPCHSIRARPEVDFDMLVEAIDLKELKIALLRPRIIK